MCHFLFACVLTLLFQPADSFTLKPTERYPCSPLKDLKGDPFRESTGIRPSLHPVTINAVAEALRLRSQRQENLPIVVSESVEPLQVALTAGRIAAEAVAKRQHTSTSDGMAMTPAEEQTIAGRVVGVVMRLKELEIDLHGRVAAIPWVKKYGEWDSFGVMESESDHTSVHDRISKDPLFTMSRAECLLALFLHTVEVPQLEKQGLAVPDKSQIDFLDQDRKDVLLSSR